MPETVVRQALADLLAAWARHAEREQHVLSFQVAMLSPQVVGAAAPPGENPVVTLQMLRTTTMLVLEDANRIGELPGADITRTRSKNLSLVLAP